jgi:hypothetical protein
VRVVGQVFVAPEIAERLEGALVAGWARLEVA